MFSRQLIFLWYGIARNTLCRLGQHSTPRGIGFDACSRGCGFSWRPNAAKPYVVTLKDGSVFQVNAINSYHAGSLVVYGNGPISIHPDGTPRGEMKVHRTNIHSIDLSTEVAG